MLYIAVSVMIIYAQLTPVLTVQVFLEDASFPGRYNMIAERSERPTGMFGSYACGLAWAHYDARC